MRKVLVDRELLERDALIMRYGLLKGWTAEALDREIAIDAALSKK